MIVATSADSCHGATQHSRTFNRAMSQMQRLRAFPYLFLSRRSQLGDCNLANRGYIQTSLVKL
jgi:hypothetical protein